MHKPSLVLFNLQYLETIQVSVDDSVSTLNILKFPTAEMGVVGKLKDLSFSSVHVHGRDNFSRICKTIVSYASSFSAKLLKLNTQKLPWRIHTV